MIGYGELLQTIGAMVIFSLILISATSLIQRNTYMQVEGAMEREVIAVAQDIIEEGRTQDFDEVTVDKALPPADIPADFTGPAYLGPEAESTRSDFDDFDDYHDWEEVVKTKHGDFNLSVKVFYVDEDTYERVDTYRTSFKKMQVVVTSSYLTGGSGEETKYNFEFIRNYYAD